ncbi:MAG: hypothetical protein R3D02_04155 [Hyphomicrobiales bacterium]
MDISLAGVVGALIGLLVAIVDYRVITGIVRGKLRERRRFASIEENERAERRLDLIFQGIFVVTVIAMMAIGYWFGLTIGG